MSEENIQQSVEISDNSETGDITLFGKVDQVVQIVRRPAAWQEAIWGFLLRNRYFLLGLVVVQAALAGTYLWYADLYLIPLWHWGVVAVLLSAAAWGWYSTKNLPATIARRGLTLALTVALLLALGWRVGKIALPERFDPAVFGIAIAELGEGPDFKRTARAREISNQIYENLCEEIRKNLASGTPTYDPCGPARAGIGSSQAEVKKIGVIPDTQTAKRHGQRLEADVVIWGQVLTSFEGGATIRFQVLQTPDRAINPEYPLVLPVSTASTEVFTGERDLPSDLRELKRLIAKQSTFISSFTLGLIAYLDLDYPQSVNFLTTAVNVMEAHPELEFSPSGRGLLYYYLGKANHALGRIEAGQEWLLRAGSEIPDEPAIPLSLALGHRSLGQLEESETARGVALDLIGTWLQTHPEDNAARYDRGIVYHMNDAYDKAILDYQAVIKSDPDFYVAYIGLGQAASAMGKFQEAEAKLLEAIALAEKTGADPAWAHLNLALVYEQDGKPGLANEEYSRALALAPQVDWMYYYYAKFLETHFELEAALLTYEALVDATPNKGWGYGELAAFQDRQGSLDRAIDNYEKAAHENPDDVLLHTYLAESYLKAEEIEKSIQEYEEAVGRDEDVYYVYASYAGALFQLGDFDLAAEMYKRALELQPRDPAVLLNLGQTYEQLTQFQFAMGIYLQILEAREQYPESAARAACERLVALGADGLC